MSNTRRAAAAQIAHFEDPGKRKTVKADLIPFTIGDELFHMVKPKTFDLAQIAMALESGVPLDDRKNVGILLRFSGQIIRYIQREPAGADGELHGRDLLESRLGDPDDALDLINLLPMFRGLMEGWFARPTGAPRGSSPSRPAQPRARGSAARTRSTRARTSTS